jgi:integrase
LAPEFADFLAATPEADRRGRVFKPLGVRLDRLTAGRVCRIISKIGKAARVKVHEKAGKVKHASAHDLRRAFGERWCKRVMPTDLQKLMRHDSIETTMRFYLSDDAEKTAATLWEAVGSNTSGNRAAESSSANEKSPSQVDAATGFSE